MDLSEEPNAGFGGMDEREVIGHISTCVESTYRKYSWDRHSIIKGWSIDDVKSEVALDLYRAKTRGSLDNVESPKAFINTTTRNFITGKLIYDGMRSYDRKLSKMAGDRVNEIESAEGRVLSNTERDRILRDIWENEWDVSEHGPRPGEGRLAVISQVNNRMHLDSLESGGAEGGRMDMGQEGSLYQGGLTPDEDFHLNQGGGLSAEDATYYESTSSAFKPWDEKAGVAGQAAKPLSTETDEGQALQAAAMSALSDAYDAPDVRPGSVKASKAASLAESAEKEGGPGYLARSYLDGDSDGKTLLAPWGGADRLSAQEADSVARMISSSGQYGEDVWQTALGAASTQKTSSA